VTYSTIALTYLLGAFPTGYIAERWLKGVDIREMGDRNIGAQNAFHHLGNDDLVDEPPW
jgi:glycerol-3-phosphate acyltransferase PlsY